MKKLLTIIAIGFTALQLQAQAPEKISYQAVARNLSGSVMPNQSVGIRFSIHDLTAAGTVVYSESHTTTTNNLGLFTLLIGGGTVESGSFASIPWETGAKFIEVEMDASGGTNYIVLGTSQLVSVPYSLYSDRSQTSVTSDSSVYSQQSGHAATSDSAVFSQQSQTSQTANIADSLAGFDPNATPVQQLNNDWMIHDADSNTIITTIPTGQPNTIAFYLNGPLRAQLFERRLHLVQPGSNTMIGDNAGTLVNPTLSATFGKRNTFLGYNAGNAGVKINRNTYIGYLSGASDTSGFSNVFVGSAAGQSFLGGSGNVFMGGSTGQNVRFGTDNVLIGGSTTAYNLEDSDYNIVIGSSAAYNMTGGDNVIVGHSAGRKVTELGGNTILGRNADLLDSNFVNATAIGYGAIVQSSNSIRFGNNSVARWGFGTNVAVNRALQVGSSATNGNGAYLTTGGVWTNASNIHLKSDITALDGKAILDKLMQLPITRWKYNGTEEYHIGPMAQDFYALFNVGLDNESISTIDPAGISLAAIQELIRYTKTLEERIRQLEQK